MDQQKDKNQINFNIPAADPNPLPSSFGFYLKG